MREELGSIKRATFGFGGYQDAEIGLNLTLGGESWGVGDFKGAWAIDRSEYAKWSEEDRRQGWADAVRLLNDTLKAAKKQHVGELAGTPIIATFDGNRLVTWRVLTEVL